LALRLVGERRAPLLLPAVGRFSIGGDAGNHLILDDPYVSAFHAYVECNERAVLHDRGSTNGTWVNGARAIAVEVERGARVRIGRTNLVVVDAEIDELAGGHAATPAAAGGTGWRMIGRSRGMARTVALVERAAQSRAHVLIQGESGTGKELLARLLHESSPRVGGPFVVVNCGAIPRELVESEFFGHERGAFTGATDRRAGVFELAHRGTLFLDEIGELPLAQQPQLLRVLETRRVRRVGGDEEHDVDVRVVAATHRDLLTAVDQSKFRLDLYHRLSTLRLTVPPLRERPEDLEMLASRFLADEVLELGPREFAADVIPALRRYHWPGNVRELRNAITSAATLSDGVITAADLLGERMSRAHRPAGGWTFKRLELPDAPQPGEAAPPALGAPPALPAPPQGDPLDADAVPLPLDAGDDAETRALAGDGAFAELCRDLYLRALAETGSIREAAARLGVPKSTFADRIRRLGLKHRNG